MVRGGPRDARATGRRLRFIFGTHENKSKNWGLEIWGCASKGKNEKSKSNGGGGGGESARSLKILKAGVITMKRKHITWALPIRKSGKKDYRGEKKNEGKWAGDKPASKTRVRKKTNGGGQKERKLH